MINSILEGISTSLNAEFGDDYTIYTEAVEQGLKEPCFFISCVSPTNKVFLGKRYYRENLICIQYFPQNKDLIKEECNDVAERLFSSLEYVGVDGDMLRGTGARCEMLDKVLNFFINYNFFVYKDSASNPMEEISEKVDVKG